jgi:hypothetical protein
MPVCLRIARLTRRHRAIHTIAGLARHEQLRSARKHTEGTEMPGR